MSVYGQLKVILERSSTTYMKKHIEAYTTRLTSVTKEWRKWVRQQLSVQYIKGTKNTSLYPKLRTGELRRSLVENKARVKKMSKISNGKARAELIIPITFRKLRDDYGEILNSSKRFSTSTFFNWKGRIAEELMRRTKGRM